MYEDVYGHCPTCGRIHWRDRGCISTESKPFWSWDKGSGRGRELTVKEREQLEMAVEQAIKAAVEEEREACAKIAGKYFDSGEIVDEIRARK